MQKLNFNLYSQLGKDLADFDTPIKIAGTSHKKARPYMFSQGDTIGLVEYYTADKYETGDIDAEGQQKIFINNVSFRAEVASKQIDIDVSSYTFIPNNEGSIYGAILERKKFHEWSNENYYGEQINDIVERFPKYGTVVTKKIGKKIEVVPLRTLKNQQDAKDLKTARYVVIEHENMSLDEMNEYPDWDTSGLDIKFGDTTTVYEYYRKVPLDWYKGYKDETILAGDEKKTIDIVAICTLEKSKEKDGRLLFIEEVDRDDIFQEVHYERRDGRWLGVGEVEKNFENQKARNMVENFRKKNLQWSGKKIFASTGDEIEQNLVTEVKDGQVLSLGMNGSLTQVDTATRATAEFSTAIQAYEDNANNKSFTYEVATGESMKSGTPFRLGVILSNSVQGYYAFKRQKLGLFLKRSFIEQILPIFKKENKKEQTIMLSHSSKEYKLLQKAIQEVLEAKKIKEALLSGSIPKMYEIANSSDMDMPFTPVVVPDNFWDTISASVTLEVVGESIDVAKKMETLTNLYTSLSQRGDPRADSVLELILSLTGETLPTTSQASTPAVPPPTAGGTMPAVPTPTNEQPMTV